MENICIMEKSEMVPVTDCPVFIMGIEEMVPVTHFG